MQDHPVSVLDIAVDAICTLSLGCGERDKRSVSLLSFVPLFVTLQKQWTGDRLAGYACTSQEEQRLDQVPFS